MFLIAICAVFPLLLVFAALHDIATMTIPNWVSAALALAFLPAAYLAGLGWAEIGMHVAAGAIALVVCAMLFFLRVFGGGDAKLIAAASIWTGWVGGYEFLLAMALSGGVLAAIIILLRRLNVRSDAGWAKRLLSPDVGAPYAVAIAFGGLWAAGASPVLAQAMSLVNL
ncbi:MAG: prepilin peptidase [Pseudomonadota bacterium]